MIEIRSSQRTPSVFVHPWVIGGALLIASPLIQFVWRPGFQHFGGAGLISTALLSASILVFAFGFRRATSNGRTDSVTARRPLGTGALVALAIWLLVAQIGWNLIYASDAAPSTLMQLNYVDSIIQFLLALVAAIQIARCGAIPAPWNWAPACVLAALSLPWVLMQLASVDLGGVRANGSMTLTVLLVIFDSTVHVFGPVFLGVLAIVLGDRAATRSRAEATVMSDSR